MQLMHGHWESKLPYYGQRELFDVINTDLMLYDFLK